MSEPKYYLTQNCNRTIQHGSLILNFEPVGLVGGAWQGVYATTKPEEIQTLTEMIKIQRNAIEEITHEQYKAKLGSKPEYVNQYNPIAEIPKNVPVSRGDKIIDRPGVQVDQTPGPEHQPDPKPTSAPVADEDVLQTGSVTAAEPTTASNKVVAAVKNAVAKAKRAVRSKAPKGPKTASPEAAQPAATATSETPVETKA